jgi:hypothetical protein
MKTAQEILDKHFPQFYFEIDNNNDILMAMEEYAKQKQGGYTREQMLSVAHFANSLPSSMNVKPFEEIMNEFISKLSPTPEEPSEAVEFVGFMQKYFFERLYGTFVYISLLQGTQDRKQYSKEDLYELFKSGNYNPEIK